MIICSSDVPLHYKLLVYLTMSALNNNLNVDDTATLLVVLLNGRFKVYIDPYQKTIQRTVFRCWIQGTSPYDAGLFYCPYVPLQMVRAVGQDTFQPKIGFKQDMVLIANPFTETEGSTGAATQ